jgi:predicted ArsR family transcriptional regulator
MRMNGNGNAKPPNSSTQRYNVLNFGKGGVTIKDAAAALGCSENMLKMHLRYLNERDGYTVIVYDDTTFKVED